MRESERIHADVVPPEIRGLEVGSSIESTVR